MEKRSDTGELRRVASVVPAPRFTRLYHLAEMDNFASIVRHGLMSTKRLLSVAEVANTRKAQLLRTHRDGPVRLSDEVVIRDQRPMPPSALAAALDDGLQPADWYEHLNSFVFLWPDRGRLERHLGACGDRPQIILEFDARALLDLMEKDVFVSPINSGNARRKPARRGLGTMIPYRKWATDGFPNGVRTRSPAEILVRGTIPVRAPYLLEITRPKQCL